MELVMEGFSEQFLLDRSLPEVNAIYTQTMRAKYAWYHNWACVQQTAAQGSGKDLKEQLKPWKKIFDKERRRQKGLKELVSRFKGKGGF